MLTTLDVHPDKLAGGWDLVADSSSTREIDTFTLSEQPCRSVATAHWHALVLTEAQQAASASQGELLVVSRITGGVVQRSRASAALGDTLLVTADPSPDALGSTAGSQPLLLAGSDGMARVTPQRAALDVWADFVATGDYQAALALIEERQEEEKLSALEAEGGQGWVATGAAHVDARLEVARARVLYGMAHAARDRGARAHMPSMRKLLYCKTHAYMSTQR